MSASSDILARRATESHGRPLPVAGGARLQAKAVHVSFGGISAINGIDLTLEQGEVLGLIGPNGAGKTTLVNVLTGFQRPSTGEVVLDGRAITWWPPRRFARAGVGRTFQNVRLFRSLTLIQNLEVAGLGTGQARSTARQRGEEILDWLGLADCAHQPADSLSYGQERLVGIARGLALAPRFLLLDEPAAGLNEGECEALMKTIAAIPGTFGCGVLLIEHNMRVVMGVCTRVQVIAFGRTIAIGTPHEIQADRGVIEAYLGEGA